MKNTRSSIAASALKLSCEFGSTQFKTTAELSPIDLSFSQLRVKQAILCAMSISQPGYNVYAAGSTGLGKRLVIMELLEKVAKSRHLPNDWAYVHHFNEPTRPIPLALPHNKGVLFQERVRAYLRQLKAQLDSGIKQEEVVTLLEGFIYKLQKTFTVNSVLNHLEVFKENMKNDLQRYFNTRTEIPLWKYQVNLLVDHSQGKRAPVIYEDNPTIENLFGKVEYVSQAGSLTTNFNMICAGSLHKANGGYLIIDAAKLLLKPDVWDALKRALTINKIKFEQETYSTEGVNLFCIKPSPIPLSVKIILIGSRSIYYMLCDEDPEHKSYFRVIADFNESCVRNSKNHLMYARLIATFSKKNNLLPLTKAAVVEAIRFSSRHIEDLKRLSLSFEFLQGLMIESNFIALKSAHKVIEKKDVITAMQNRSKRGERLPDQMLEEFKRKYLLFEVKKSVVGQVNGLTVESQGDIAYGHPVRITAIARIGRSAEVVNIDREVDLSGSIHAKGVLILSGYLRGKYLPKQSLSISASIVFEQTYEIVDGDSASMAELVALLSAIAEIPVHQSIAVTGSINQHGEVQAVSGLNEKIESFFAVCKQTGLTGKQGVILPQSNVQNLVLTDEVMQAIERKKFHLYPVKNVDEALTLLSDMPAGKRNKQGFYPADTFNHRVEITLKEFTKEVIEEKTGEASESGEIAEL